MRGGEGSLRVGGRGLIYRRETDGHRLKASLCLGIWRHRKLDVHGTLIINGSDCSISVLQCLINAEASRVSMGDTPPFLSVAKTSALPIANSKGFSSLSRCICCSCFFSFFSRCLFLFFSVFLFQLFAQVFSSSSGALFSHVVLSAFPRLFLLIHDVFCAQKRQLCIALPWMHFWTRRSSVGYAVRHRQFVIELILRHPSFVQNCLLWVKFK